ncbi:sn-glycerol-3-phosphate ABC transporter ATP-binding protein UgpC [Phaeobacter sp. J2-8]|uniref:ABC transporter ATP-binding protein n=1 Tax=Phaeobacter sp. J2-8 TaxID=2931394 RepID=UPI001FD42BF1|nr:sn-glycerol-3-phosphate ABC transporter ATP-binding protein UgpC [Phaeobacter sp. J2-8]MCJ7874352.1 sn-glycerol-3-phosphate ABC transporter ATP-binding protein UgpC [Phaeobacter sp. J2-8]
MATITLDKIEKNYGAVKAIHGIDLAINDGEFVALVGPSGCGKSTLLRMVAGLEDISGGRLLIGDKVVNSVEPRDRDIAMVFQDYALYPHMSVADNIGFGLKMRKTSDADRKTRIAEAAQMLQIEKYLDRRPAELSGGQRQRVAMGRAIVRRPSAFLFDEPLSNLDAKLRVEMRTEIKRLHGLLGRTTLYVTHDQVEALTLADRVVILKDGRILQEGPPLELYEHPATRFVAEFIGSPQMNIFDGVVRKADTGTGVDVAGLVLPFDGIDAPDGAKVHLGARPEAISPSDTDAADVTATVEVFEPLGSDTMVSVRIAGAMAVVRLSPETPVARGMSLPLRFDRSKLHLFDAETGNRIDTRPGS